MLCSLCLVRFVLNNFISRVDVQTVGAANCQMRSSPCTDHRPNHLATMATCDMTCATTQIMLLIIQHSACHCVQLQLGVLHVTAACTHQLADRQPQHQRPNEQQKHTCQHAHQVYHRRAAEHYTEGQQHPGQVWSCECEYPQEAQVDVLMPPCPHIHLNDQLLTLHVSLPSCLCSELSDGSKISISDLHVRDD